MNDKEIKIQNLQDQQIDSSKLVNNLNPEHNTIINNKFDSLGNTQIWGYAVGHFLNDLCAACWFNYLLYYLTQVITIQEENNTYYAGLVMLSGQIADGLSTPIVGYLSDKTQTKFGKRTPWYFGGVILVCVCFMFIFSQCSMCVVFDNYSNDTKLINFIFFPSMFNVGWAAVQVSHMSLVPSLTVSRSRRDKLNNLRNTFTYIANFFVLSLALVLFIFIESPQSQFKALSLIVTGIGLITAVFFLSIVNEVELTKQCLMKLTNIMLSGNIDDEDLVLDQPENLKQKQPASDREHEIEQFQEENTRPNLFFQREQTSENLQQTKEYQVQITKEIDKEFKNYAQSQDEDKDGNEIILSQNSALISLSGSIVSWQQWFKELMFYQYGIVYMCVRLSVNVSSSMMPYYLISVVGFATENTQTSTNPLIAVVPIILYLTSVIISSKTQQFYQKFGRTKTYSIGVLILLGASVIMMFLNKESGYLMFIVAIFIGGAQSIILNTGLNLIAEVIGIRGSSGAFVYGAYSLLEKIANGFYIVTIPTVAALFAWILILVGGAKDYAVTSTKIDKSILKKEVYQFSEQDELTDYKSKQQTLHEL